MIKFLSGSDKDTENFVLKELSPQRKWVWGSYSVNRFENRDGRLISLFWGSAVRPALTTCLLLIHWKKIYKAFARELWVYIPEKYSLISLHIFLT